jgi:hypothetical protein
MCILIQGQKQPGFDMYLYLGLLKEELATLWETPPRTWDAYSEDYFPLRVVLFTMVQDYLGYSYVSGQVNHGHNACVRCMDITAVGRMPSRGKPPPRHQDLPGDA